MRRPLPTPFSSLTSLRFYIGNSAESREVQEELERGGNGETAPPAHTEGDMHMKKTKLNTHPWLGMSLTLLAFGAAAAVPQAQVRAVTLDIKAQPIGSALNEFARQSGVQVLFYSDVSDGVSVAGLAGTFAPDAALTKLLSNTGLTFEYVNSRTVAIHRAVGNVSQGSATHGESEHLFMRLGNVQMAEMPNEDQQVKAAATVQEPARSQRQGRGVEEVIVTATRRVERLQDVPLSIAAITAEEIERRGLVNAADYLRGIPGANQVEGPYGQSIVIRGIETSPHLQNFFSGATTATYFGEIPTTNAAGLLSATGIDLKLVDIERVEVLRGPQGTAFGSSSLGGAVRTIPVSPNVERFEGRVAVGYSATSGTGGDNYNVQASGNIPLIEDKLAIRAVAYQSEDSGYYRNRAGSDAAFQAAVVARYGAEDFAADREEVGSYRVLGGRIAALLQASDNLRFTLTYLSQKTETDGFALANSGVYEQTLLQVDPQHVVRGQAGGVSDTDIDIANATMQYDLGWGDLLATYSYLKSGSIQAYPYGAAALEWPVSSEARSDHRQDVGEIRLATRFDGAWNFLAGFYFDDMKDESLGDNRWHGDIATSFLGTDPAVGTSFNWSNLQQIAAFGEASWELLKGLTLTGGVRAYEYDRSFRVESVGFFYGGPAGSRAQDEAKDSGESFRANLSYKIDDGALVYGGWAQGFRLGKPQAGLNPSVCDRDGNGLVDGTGITIASTKRTDSDDVDSYEIGGKFALLDRRLTIDAAVFRMEWSGVPVQVRPGSAPCIAGYVANAGAALSEGVEFQANFQITPQWRVDLGASRIRARVTEPVPALNVPAGSRLPGSPELNANLSVRYDFELGGHQTSVRADSIYVGSFYGNLAQTPNLESDAYLKLDVSARVDFGNLNIDLFVQNLTNEDAFSFRSTFAAAGPLFGYRQRPRTIGLRLGYTF